jgi:hypothetical protein
MPRAIRQAIYDVESRTYRIPLTRGMQAIVDFEDIEFLSQWNWCSKVSHTGNMYGNRFSWKPDGGKTNTMMHRELALHWGWEADGMFVDHINLNTLDNRRHNLRVVNNTQNRWNTRRQSNNTSGVKGVNWSEEHQKWHAKIGVGYKRLHLGFFDNLADAAAAYEEASKKYHGEFGRTDSLH